ncbi:tetratricopeptide repeat protein [Oscillatoria sp. CS-180]|uniref:tetratricopeptide repeat protein n=1 Tax=Oscillatoria sp. CS-180 TaxID=3021720 RepID=UPI00232CD8DF|nr:tetratricopeptide repeat protein [Oscillatoria sp. CS-180]MDB9525632.1 tetratricopeptide repeat protein [Oscillatoria sp. CS-180]
MSRRIYPESDVIDIGSTMVQPFMRRCTSYAARQESVKQIRKKIRQAVDNRDFIRAIALLNRLMAKHTATAEDYSNRGLIHLWSGHPYKAIKDFDQAIALNPNLPAAYNNRANYYAAQGAKESAIADYERTIDLNPFHVRARINRAITLRDLGRYDAALESLEEALLFRKMTGEIYAERGRTYHLRGDWNCAIADYRHALTFFDTHTHTTMPEMPSRRRQIMIWLNHLQTAAS